MDLSESLKLYNIHLRKLLDDYQTRERFKLLGNYECLGCFCQPGSKCHVDIIRFYLHHLGVDVPKRQCVKVKWLRKETGCDNLEEWLSNPKNMLCTRRGRIFIGSQIQGNHRVYHYPQSEWANPYKLK
jgi:hypothetical protein